MSFLDSLENNLKALENRESHDPTERKRRDTEHERMRAAAPWAERLRESPFTKHLLDAAARAGHERRAKLHIAWLQATLRLELRERRLELRPTPEGIVAVSVSEGTEVFTEPVDLSAAPEPLVERWLS